YYAIGMATEAQPSPDQLRAQVPPQLIPLLEALHPDTSLAARLDALENLAHVVLDISRLRRTAPAQLARLHSLLEALKSVAAYRERLSATLASVLRDSSAVALFAEAGLPSDRGLARETFERIARRVLPRPPDDEDLERFVSRIFRRPRDCAWIEAAPVEVFV